LEVEDRRGTKTDSREVKSRLKNRSWERKKKNSSIPVIRERINHFLPQRENLRNIKLAKKKTEKIHRSIAQDLVQTSDQKKSKLHMLVLLWERKKEKETQRTVKGVGIENQYRPVSFIFTTGSLKRDLVCVKTRVAGGGRNTGMGSLLP